MRYFKRVVGENVYLSPVNPDDVEIYTKWMHDPEIAQFMHFRTQLVSLPSERRMLEQFTDGGYVFAIVRKDDDTLIGNVGLANFDNIARRATLGIFIGESDNHSRGYGAEAIRLILEYGFNTLNLHNIELTTHEDNARAYACYKKAGFREYGRRRDGTFKHGRYMDYICMDILEHEFREKYGK